MTENMHIEAISDDEEMDLMKTGTGEDSREMAVGDVKDLTGDGGIIKKLLVKGQGWEQPQKDDKVSVHYTGTLEDGTKFDSSVDRGEPFQFTLGHSQVIKGWDVGVATMKKGEKVQLRLRHDYAYGERGNPPTIPPSATLLFDVELLSWESVNDLSEEKDGSIMKTVVREGDLDVWDRPKGDDLVTVRLSARVQGAAEPFAHDEVAEFRVDDGWFCPAVRTAVKDMKKGEHVTLKVAARHAFGAAGRDGCPPHSDVQLDLELQAVKAVSAIDPDHAGAIMKTVIKAGAAYNTPSDASDVTVSWTGTLADGTQFDQVTERTVKTSADAFPCDALEIAVMSMKAGEVADVAVKDPAYAFGAAGVPGTVPPGEAVRYRVELHSFLNGKETYELDAAEKLERAGGFKALGNAAFKVGALKRARRYYDKVDAVLSMEQDFSDADKARAKDIKVSTSLNTAAADLKEGRFKECVSLCSKVLDMRPGNVKALYRRSQAHLELGDLLEAENDIKAALLVEPESRDLAAAARRLKQRTKAANKQDKKLFGAMFSKVGAMYEDHVVAAPHDPNEAVYEGEAAGAADAAPAEDAEMGDGDEADA